MYIPIAYWQPGGQGTPHMRINWFHNGAETINYYYDGVAKTTPITTINAITPVCMDATSYTNFLTQNAYPGGGAYFCTATPSGSSTCCINCYPQTGPEAWYIDVNYENNFDIDMGTYYYNYIDQKGNIINDTLTFGQTKRIISQSNPLFRKETQAGFTYGSRIAWTVISKFPGEVLAYPYKDIPALYTMTLKRATYGQPSSQQFNTYFYNSASFSNNNWVNTNTGSFRTYVSSNIGDTSSIICVNPPIESSAFSANVPNAWITSVIPVIAQYNIKSCISAATYSVNLQTSASYSVGTIIKTNSSDLPGCWSILSFTNSGSSLPNYTTTVSSTYTSCIDCNTGYLSSSIAITSSLITLYDIAYTSSYNGSGTTIYDLSGNTNNGTIANLSYWNYNTSSLVAPTLAKNTGGVNTQIDLPEINATNYTLLLSWYGQNRIFNIYGVGAPIFFDKDQDPGNNQYGISSLSNDSAVVAIIDGTNPINLNVTSSATLNKWHISQVSLSTTGTGSYCLDGITGSYTGSGGGIALQFSILGDTLNQSTVGYGSGSMFQVAAVYTSSLSTSQMLQNWNSMKVRY